VSACEAAQQQGAEPEIEQVATSPHQWTGIGVTSSGRIYVNFPRWSDDVPISVGYLGGDGGVLPFPDAAWNSWEPGEADFTNRFVAVQSVVAVGDDVWVLDTGRPRFGTILPGAPRLFRFDGDGRKLTEYPVFGAVKPTSYLNDVRFSTDLSRAYITDSGAGGLVVIDLETGAAHRALDGHPSTMATGTRVVIDGTPWGSDEDPPQVHADGIALFGEHLYFQALTARTLYRVPLQLLERDVSAETRATGVEAVAEVGPSDGLIAGPDGSIYLSSLEHNAVRVLRPDGSIEVVAQDPLIAWPDSFSFGPDGSLYVTTSRIHQGPVPPGPYGVLRIFDR
jgi:sugar lactone lactonase YvrE